MVFENQVLNGGSTYFQLARFFITMIIGVAGTRLVLMPLSRKILAKRGDKKALHSIENLVGVVGLFLAFTVALQAGDFGGLATIIGAIAAALTVAVGFGMRDQVSSVVGGIFIHLDNSFVKGDYIKTGEFEGVVKEVKLRATVLNGTATDKLVVPNSVLTNGVVKNYTKGNRTKTSLDISLGALDYEEHVEVLESAAKDQQQVLTSPEPEVVLKGVEGDEITAELQYWIKYSEDKKGVRSRVLRNYVSEAVERGLIKEEQREEE